MNFKLISEGKTYQYPTHADFSDHRKQMEKDGWEIVKKIIHPIYTVIYTKSN